MQSLWWELVTQVFCPLCYCPVVVIRIHFKRLFPLLTGAKSLLSQWLTNSYLHLLNLPPPNLQLTDPVLTGDKERSATPTCYVCVLFRLWNAFFFPCCPSMNQLTHSPWLRSTAVWIDLAEENQDRKQKIGSTCPADKLQLISIHLDKQRNTIFGLLFFGYRWCNTPEARLQTGRNSLGNVVLYHRRRWLPRVAPWCSLSKKTGCYAETMCLCVCFPQILLLLRTRRGMDRNGGQQELLQ